MASRVMAGDIAENNVPFAFVRLISRALAIFCFDIDALTCTGNDIFVDLINHAVLLEVCHRVV